jgi:DNA-3-methyladenine glycosylase II
VEVDVATAALARLDRTMAAHIERIGPCTMRPREGGRSHFEAIARSIAYQQLAGAAASTIWGRVRKLVDGRFTADAIVALTDEQLRGAGLSTNKTRSLRDLAEHVVDGHLKLDRIARKSDEDVIDDLTRVRGIGRWTAEMFLMFQLGRLDIWPVGDLGVRNGYGKIYGLDEVPTVKELAAGGEAFRPYRSIAAWYCWRAVDTVLPA